MEVVIRPDALSAARLAARLVADALRAKPRLVLGLATGRTMERVYAELARLHTDEGLDFSLCRTFNLDEYVGLSPTDPHSYRAYMNAHLFDRVNIDKRNTHVPNGMAADLPAECHAYEAAIKGCGGIDLQLLGIGSDGHIGFNEPLSALRSRTREIALAPSTLAQNAALFGGDTGRVPRRALTMGVGTIIEASRILMLVTGESKAAVLAKAVEGPITSMISASALQFHAQCRVIVDEEAAQLLEGKDHYRWIFANEPEWVPYQGA
ncbi:MAG: Glucosamine-6-phosphate deaminase 1 [Lentisphaerae bacterium ADurb.BinA184]|nr:MAG: Glucosamine-6-phosphate deaminase 1 [Lentisphaerae bacterium ADurb.BinA184]